MKTKLLSLLLVALGVFALAGTSSAAQIVLQPAADTLSPGSATTFIESLRVGIAGQGGVTFFNGSVLNESGPMVIADDLNVWGEIWRGESKGDGDGKPLKISDSMVPTLSDLNDLGSSDLRWDNIYANAINYSDTLKGKGAIISGDLTVDGDANFGGGYTNGGSGVTIKPNGDVSINGNLTVDGIIDPQSLWAYNLMPDPLNADPDANEWLPQGWIGYPGHEWAGAYIGNTSVQAINLHDGIWNSAGTGRIAYAGEDIDTGYLSSFMMESVNGGDIEVYNSADGPTNNFTIKARTILKLEDQGEPHSCDSDHAGEIYYDNFDHVFYGCNGFYWAQMTAPPVL